LGNTRIVSELLTKDADQTTKNANVDGSVTPAEFILKPSASGFLGDVLIARLIVLIEDNGNITANDYGAVPTLATGVRVQHRSDSDTIDLDGGLGVTSNADWARLCYDITEHSFGSGNNFVTARWTFSRSGRFLELENDEELVVTIGDDLTGLVSHYFMVQGFQS